MNNILPYITLITSRFFRSLKAPLKSQKGVGVIEVILILLVLVGLVAIFRTQLNSIISTVFATVNEKIDSF